MSRPAIPHRVRVERLKRRILDLLDQLAMPLPATTIGAWFGVKPGPALDDALADLVASGELGVVVRPHGQSRLGRRLVTCYFTEPAV